MGKVTSGWLKLQGGLGIKITNIVNCVSKFWIRVDALNYSLFTSDPHLNGTYKEYVHTRTSWDKEIDFVQPRLNTISFSD